MRVLVLGGTSQASELAVLLAGRRDIQAMLSFAGRTVAPVAPPISFRIGGFGGPDGLAAYLKAERIDILVDATHPFADRISRNASIAAGKTNIPLITLSRPAWTREAGDDWIEASDMESAVAALGCEPKRVFLTVGRLQLQAFEAAPQHFYLIRSIDPSAAPLNLPHHRMIAARGPFAVEAEEHLLRAEKIDVIVAKNSGAAAVFGKILAARRLGVPVIMIERPPIGAQAVHDPTDVITFILRHGAISALRGV
ncbi:MAG: cobalt-precorrin-6A reductase [Methylocella sp.]